MNIKTKFSNGDKVYGNRISHSTRKKIKCKTCQGTARVRINNTDRTTYCPDCNSDGTIWVDEPCCVVSPFEGTIGRVNAEYYGENNENKSGVSRITYMLDAYGIGSGSIFDEDDLFLSRKLAKAHVKKIEAKWIRSQAKITA